MIFKLILLQTGSGLHSHVERRQTAFSHSPQKGRCWVTQDRLDQVCVYPESHLFLPWNDWDIYSAVSGKEKIRARWTEAKWHSSGNKCMCEGGDEKASGLFLQPKESWERGILCLLDLRQILPCAWKKKKKVPTASWKISAQKREIRVQWFLHGSPSAQVHPWEHIPLTQQPARSVRILKGRNNICLLLISLEGMELQHCCPIQLFGWDLMFL